MKIAQLLLTTIASYCLTFPVYAYNQAQLDAFEANNSCTACDLSSAEIKPNHSGADLNSSNLSSLNNTHFFATPLNLANANLRDANLTNANLLFANLSGADLTGARLDGALLTGANLYQAKGVNLTNVSDTCWATLPDGTNAPC